MESLQELAMDFMHKHGQNLYAADTKIALRICCNDVDVESIWYSEERDKIMLHVGCKEFEGDIDIDSLSDENQEILRKNLTAANNKAFKGESEYWPFLETYMKDYDYSERIAEIVDIENELDEHMATMDEQKFNDCRKELRRLTLKCFDEALCNYINKKYPGAVRIDENDNNNEGLLHETIVMLSADIYQKVYDSDECFCYTDAAREIIRLAKEFEKELNWKKNDDRDYIVELEKFEKKVLENLIK